MTDENFGRTERRVEGPRRTSRRKTYRKPEGVLSPGPEKTREEETTVTGPDTSIYD